MGQIIDTIYFPIVLNTHTRGTWEQHYYLLSELRWNHVSQ